MDDLKNLHLQTACVPVYHIYRDIIQLFLDICLDKRIKTIEFKKGIFKSIHERIIFFKQFLCVIIVPKPTDINFIII